MKKTIFIILQLLVVVAAIVLTFWTIEESTKLHSPRWIDLLYVWSIVLWIVAILSFVFKKKILQMSGLTMTLVILCAVLTAGAIIDTYYAIDILSQDIVAKSKLNQSLLCVLFWSVSITLFVLARKRITSGKGTVC